MDWLAFYGFLSAPKTIEEAKAMVAASHHSDGHGETHGEDHATATPAEEAQHGDEHGVSSPVHETEAHGEAHDASHDEHVFHQLSNKPWAALYVAAFFFFMISLGTLAFYAINRAAQAGGHQCSFVLWKELPPISYLGAL